MHAGSMPGWSQRSQLVCVTATKRIFSAETRRGGLAVTVAFAGVLTARREFLTE